MSTQPLAVIPAPPLPSFPRRRESSQLCPPLGAVFISLGPRMREDDGGVRANDVN